MTELATVAPASASATRTPQRKLLVGLIGAGIQRSLTPVLHEEEARHHGLRLHYQLIDLERTASDLDALPGLLQAVRTMGFAGLNITYPCKQAVIPLLDDLSEEARAMGAVNTVVVDRDHRLIGHNTDGTGWAWGFRRALPHADLSAVVVLGAGGAGAAIAHTLLRLGAERLVLVDRDHTRAQALADALNARHGNGRAHAQYDIALALHHASGLVHATPTGMDKLPGLPLPVELLRPTLWVAEVVYFPLETELLKAARRIGCPTVDGGGMAVGQALGAFELFTGMPPDAQRMEGHFRRLVAQRHGH